MKPDFLYTISLLMILFLMYSCDSSYRDSKGNYHNSVRIGDKEWMTQNLNAGQFLNGDSIPVVKDVKAWELAGLEGKPACCYFENNPENGEKYGRLYNWYAITDPRGLVPQGWHLPDGEEWEKLIRNLGGVDAAGERLKAGKGWAMDCNGNNSSGFSALPGGYRHYSGIFNLYDTSGGAYWWGANEGFVYITCSYPVYLSKGGTGRSFTSKARGFSVRLVKD